MQGLKNLHRLLVCHFKCFSEALAWFQEDEFSDRMHLIPEVAAPPKKETAWERGLKLAKEVSWLKSSIDAQMSQAHFMSGSCIIGDYWDVV